MHKAGVGLTVQLPYLGSLVGYMECILHEWLSLLCLSSQWERCLFVYPSVVKFGKHTYLLVNLFSVIVFNSPCDLSALCPGWSRTTRCRVHQHRGGWACTYSPVSRSLLRPSGRSVLLWPSPSSHKYIWILQMQKGGKTQKTDMNFN